MDEQQRGPRGGRPGRILGVMPGVGLEAWQPGSWRAAVDIYETVDAFVVYLDVAGVDPAAIRVTATEETLTVAGEKGYPPPSQVRRVQQLEIERGCFEQKITLPRPILVDAVSATFRHGLLVVVLPRRQEQKRVRIPVQSVP